MLTQQYSQIAKTRAPIMSSPQGRGEIMDKKVPEYFQVSKDFETMTVGSKFSPYKIANISDYDCYVLAGIEENELFSKLIMMNMNIQFGLAFDSNIHKISHHFPDNIQIINKKVSFRNDDFHENLSEMGGKKDVFLKMNIYGEEYLWVLALGEENLQCFKQMVIVFHDINNNPTQQRAINKIKCFQKLTKTHDIVNVSPVGENLIVTYFRKELSEEMIDDEQSQENKAELPLSPKNSLGVDKLSELKLSLQNTVKDLVKNVEKEIIETVSTNLKTEFDNEIEKILKKFDEDSVNSNENEIEENITQKIERTQERVKEFVKGLDSNLKQTDFLADTVDVNDSHVFGKIEGDTDIQSTYEEELHNNQVEQAIQEDQDKEKNDAPTFSDKPTFSDVKPFSPEPLELKGRNAKKNAKKAAKKRIALEELKEDSAEDKSSSSSPEKEQLLTSETDEVSLVVEDD